MVYVFMFLLLLIVIILVAALLDLPVEDIIVYDCTFNFIYLMYLNSNYDTDFIMSCNKKV